MAGRAGKRGDISGLKEYLYFYQEYILKIYLDNGAIAEITVEKNKSDNLSRDEATSRVSENLSALTERIKKDFDSYFSGEKKGFTLPLAVKGTDYQKRVWECLRTIPYGKTVSYRQLAAMAGNPAAARAAAAACRANLFPVVIPCHRVIASDGSIGGYSGKERLTGFKKMLLEIEGAVIHGPDGDLFRSL